MNGWRGILVQCIPVLRIVENNAQPYRITLMLVSAAGLTGTLKWSLRFTAFEHIIPGLLPSSASNVCMVCIAEHGVEANC